MRPIDVDALIEFCAERWIPLNIDAVNMQPTIQPEERTEERTETHACDLISRQAAIDIDQNATVDTNPSHFEAHQKFTQFMDDAEISSFGRWQWSNGFNTALTAVGIDLKKLPPAQPEPHEGHWIWVAGDLECSKCHTRYPDLYPGYDNSVACPHCGAKMKGEPNE